MFVTYMGSSLTTVTGAYQETKTENTLDVDTVISALIDIGAFTAGRRIVVVVQWKSTSVARTLSSIRYAATEAELTFGPFANLSIHAQNSADKERSVAICSFSDDTFTGTDGYIRTVFSGKLNTGNVSVSTYLLSSSTCTVTDDDTDSSNNAATAVSVSNGDFIVSGMAANNVTGSANWTGATEDSDSTFGISARRISTASHAVTATDSSYDTSVALSTDGDITLISAVFHPD